MKLNLYLVKSDESGQTFEVRAKNRRTLAKRYPGTKYTILKLMRESDKTIGKN